MRKKFVVLSLANAPHSVETYHEVLQNLKKRHFKIKHIGLTSRQWLPSESPHTGLVYKKYGYRFYEIPRPNFGKIPVVVGSGYKKEFKTSFFLIVDFIDMLIRRYEPDIFVMDGSRYLSLLFLKRLKQRLNIPVVFIEHGNTDFDYIKVYKNIYWKKVVDVYRFFRYDLRDWFKKTFLHFDDIQIYYSDPRIMLYGENGSDYICAFSQMTYDCFVKFGINRKKVRLTGYPYFDKLHRLQRKFSSVVPKRKGKRILIVSSGLASVYRAEAVRFYRFVIKIKETLGDEYEIFLRLKPGVDPHKFLPRTLMKNLDDVGIRYDDNRKPSYRAVQKYDLVIGDPSMVLLEAIIFRKPIVIFQISALEAVEIFVQRFWREEFNAKTVATVTDLIKFLKGDIEEYKNMLWKNFKKNEGAIMGKFDGRSAERIADVILEAVNSTETIAQISSGRV